MMERSVKVRAWTKEDLPGIRTILWETWMATYSKFIPESDLRGYLDTHYSLQALHTIFANPDMYGFVAQVDDALAGCMRCTHARDEGRFYVNSVYVLPVHQQLGVGTRLMDTAEQQAISCGCDAIWLGVMQQNVAARAWYERIGFTFGEEAPFVMGATTVTHVIGSKPIAERATQDNLLSRSHKE